MSRITRAAKAARNQGWRGLLQVPPWPVRRAWRPWRASIPLTFKALLALLLVVVVVAAGLGYLERARRTAEAAVEIIRLDSHHSPGKGARGSVDVQYRFDVDGVTYTFLAVRSWRIEDAQNAKVCYEPGNPPNQALTKASEPCG